MFDRANELDMLVLERVEGVFIATVELLLLLLMVELAAVEITVGLAFDVILELEGFVESVEANEPCCEELFCAVTFRGESG